VLVACAVDRLLDEGLEGRRAPLLLGAELTALVPPSQRVTPLDLDSTNKFVLVAIDDG
jgi:hypothetical protein